MNNIIYVGFNNNKKLDDWLITPPVRDGGRKGLRAQFQALEPGAYL